MPRWAIGGKDPCQAGKESAIKAAFALGPRTPLSGQPFSKRNGALLMSTRVSGPESPIISSRDELAAYLEAGCKPTSDWRIGTEHEKFGFYKKSRAPVPYDGDRGIRALLEGLRDFGWDSVTEKDNIIALRRKDCPRGGAISLEPGGQLELSGAPLETVHQTIEEIRQHLAEVAEVGGFFGIGFLGMGFS